MNDTIVTTGVIATELKRLTTSEGLTITSFRLAAGQRKLNRQTKTMEQGETNWYTVTAFRQLALNVAGSLQKGDRVVVTGRLKIRKWDSGEREGTVVEIDADAIGHDLAWGTSTFTRVARAPRPVEPSAVSPSEFDTSDREAAGDGFVPRDSPPMALDASGWALPAMAATTG